MSFQDPLLGGPLPPPDPGEKLPPGELAPQERGQDPAREGVEEGLTDVPSRPLDDEEKEAARHDPGRQPRTFAPQSERVPKEPLPGDDKLLEGEAVRESRDPLDT